MTPQNLTDLKRILREEGIDNVLLLLYAIQRQKLEQKQQTTALEGR